VPEEAVARAAVLHASGITLALGPQPAQAVARAIAVARAAGTIVSFDVNHRRTLWSDAEAAEAAAKVLPDCDVVFARLDDARLLIGDVDAEAAARALEALGPRQVLITLGADECVARIDGVSFQVPAPVVPVVDTVGAGDAFVAGYLAELVTGAPPARRLATAVAAGALAVGASGDWEGMPHRDALSLQDQVEPVTR
jgi:2-dehydro-3-deoxygluconokinase